MKINWNEPMRKKDWAALYIVCIALCVIMYAPFYISIMWEKIDRMKSKIKKLFKK